jgi:hypothetical protein
MKFRFFIVQVKMVHLGRNPITVKGWEEFKNIFIDEDTATGAGQGKSYY